MEDFRPPHIFFFLVLSPPKRERKKGFSRGSDGPTTPTSLAALALTPGQLDASVPITNPFGLAGATGFLQLAANFGVTFFVIGSLATALSLIVRLRRAHGVERQQIKLLVAALVVYIATLAAVVATVPGPGSTLSLATNLAFVLQALAYVLVAAAVGVAILRHHLWDIGLIIRRTLVYSVLTLALGAVYVAVVIALQALFRQLTGQASTLAVVASTLVIAALFVPLRSRAQT